MSAPILFIILLCAVTRLGAQGRMDASAIEAETLQHFQALLQLDTSSPPGNEVLAVDYLKQVLDKEGIPYQVFASDPKRPNIVVRIKGNGKKKPLLVMGHTDVVTVDPKKWTHPPFGADVATAATSTAAARWTTRTTSSPASCSCSCSSARTPRSIAT